MEKERLDFSNSLLVMYTEPEPLQVDNSTHEEDLAANATEWVQANMIKLGQQFGVVFKGCKKEAYTMLAKLDQRREKETRKGKKMKTIKSNNDVPKEVRNLFFDMNFKDGEPRSSGRVLALTNQWE
uniref:Putative ovule protein n=1 Tax=Solanum chacoense TaxID=4108 RepID=A0A0V0H5J5_SOLCH